MALPAGFNPNNMSFGKIVKAAPKIEIPRNTTTYSSSGWSTSQNRSLWWHFNRGVANIGNWFSEHAEGALGVCSILVTAGIVIAGLIYVVKGWMDHGFWMALLITVGTYIACLIIWYISSFVIVIGVNIVMYGLRWLFWNGWTFLLALTLAIGCWVWIANSVPSYSHQHAQTQTAAPAVQTYQCSAAVLNVRTEPNTYSNTIGTLRKGQQVEVYATSNGFARISYNGHTGYVSLKYLNKVN